MAEHIVLSKAESQSWGFRLTGGLDFGTPLTIIKVSKGSVAEKEGLRVGDMLLAIDDIPLVQMTHGQATEQVVKAGDRFKVTIVRGSFALPPQLVQGPKPPPEEDASAKEAVAADPPILEAPLDLPDLPPLLATIINDGLQDQPVDDGTFTEVTAPLQIQQVVEHQGQEQGAPEQGAPEQGAPEAEHVEYTEEEIAEMMSGCAEVLMGTCIGVDFQKLPPDTDIMKSEVLQLLIADKCETPARRLSSFNQRPNRPVPKAKGVPDTPKIPYYPMKYVPQKKKDEPATDGPILEQLPVVEEPQEPQEHPPVVAEEPQEPPPVVAEEPQEPPPVVAEEPPAVEEPETPVPDQEGGEAEHTQSVAMLDEAELEQQDTYDIESQLAEIQRQLTEIVQLPVAIQEHLTFIQQQLAKILALRAAEAAEQKQEEIVEEPIPEEEPQPEVVEPEIKEEEAPVPVTEPVVEEPVPEPESEPEPEPEIDPHKKDIPWKKEEYVYKPNKPFFPLTPQPRPVKLPGGRKWFAPKDVYTEDFIAETLSGNEEVIRGTTIGVDFHKFERSYDHLKSSSVYKMVHSADEQQVRMPGSFVNKTEKDHAVEDYVTTDTEPPTTG